MELRDKEFTVINLHNVNTVHIDVQSDFGTTIRCFLIIDFVGGGFSGVYEYEVGDEEFIHEDRNIIAKWMSEGEQNVRQKA